MATGCSTNAIIHLIAIARRAGINLALERFDELSARVPVIANIRPSGKYLMEDFYYAGGLPGLMKRISNHLDLSQKNVLGHTLAEVLDEANVWNDDVIRTVDQPISSANGLAVLRGNLAALSDIQVNSGDISFAGALFVFGLYSALMSKRPKINPLSLIAFTTGAGAVMLLGLTGRYVVAGLFDRLRRPARPVPPQTRLLPAPGRITAASRSRGQSRRGW